MTGENSDVITMEPPHIYVERTLALIKPDVINKSEEIEDIILRSGFAILQVIDLFSYVIYNRLIDLTNIPRGCFGTIDVRPDVVKYRLSMKLCL